MPKKTEEKNTKGKKNNSKTTTAKKVTTRKTTNVKNVETPKTKAEVKEVTVVKKETKKGKKIELLNNTPFVICACIIILLVAILIFVLCIKKVPTTSNGSDIVASIKGKDITADELYSSLKDNNGTAEMLNIIDTYISDKEVTITKDNEAYVQEIVDYYKEYAEYYKTDLKTFLINYAGITGIDNEKEFYNFVLEDYKKTLAVQQYIAEEAEEKDLKEYYKENYFDTLTVKHILIEVDEDEEDTKEAEKEAYNKAVKLIKELDKVKKDNLDKEFEKLAEKNSDDTATYSNGGLIENFSKKDVVSEFYEASSKLKNGEYTKEPIKSSYGYHIILKVSSTPVKEYKEIKEDVKKAYVEALLTEDSTLFTTKWDELRKKYDLSIEDDFLKKEYKETIAQAKTPVEEEK